MILYDYILSPSCFKIRLMAALTKTTLTLRPVRFPSWPRTSRAGTARAQSRRLHSDPGRWRSGADRILGHAGLSRSLAAPECLGSGLAAERARIEQWLSFSHRLTANLGGARLHDMLLRPGDIDTLRANGIAALRELEARCSNSGWRASPFWCPTARPSPTSPAFPMWLLAPDGGVTLDPYPSIRLWMRAIRALEGFIEMPGIHRLHDLKPEPDHAAGAA